MFFFFFDELYDIPEVQESFFTVIGSRLLNYGYFDMNEYIKITKNKDQLREELKGIHSKYELLYKGSYPAKEKAYEFWMKNIGAIDNGSYDNEELGPLEAKAIVNWIYRIINNQEDRASFTIELIKIIKTDYSIEDTISYKDGIIYFDSLIDLYFVKQIDDVTKILQLLLKPTKEVFFRGHSNVNYLLLPFVLRGTGLQTSEREMFNELQIECPGEFESCNTAFEKLVKMQHYGLPTRLLDITRNLLVALYFACESDPEKYGELVVLESNKKDIEYPQGDKISVLSNLASLSYKEKEGLLKTATKKPFDKIAFDRKSEPLINEIRREKPYFYPPIDRQELTKNFFVYALKNNARIIAQNGAFIICGLTDRIDALEDYRLKRNGKKVIFIVTKKKQILKQLDGYAINRATLFPEIDNVAGYIRQKYE